MDFYHASPKPIDHFGPEHFSKSHFGTDVSSREHFGTLALRTFRQMDFSTPDRFDMGNFRHGEFLARGIFGTRTFRHRDISAPERFGTWIFWHLAKQCGHFGTDISAPGPKCPCAEMSPCRDAPVPKNPSAEKSPCRNVPVLKCPSAGMSAALNGARAEIFP